MVKIFEMKRYGSFLFLFKFDIRTMQILYYNWLCFMQAKVLRSMRQLKLDDIVLGQHKASSKENVATYMDSLTPTFFAGALYIDNARWDGVPFLIKSGMGLIKHR